ncbi:MAG: DUF4265 domain-containing protein [Candidatus Cybelea sp.]
MSERETLTPHSHDQVKVVFPLEEGPAVAEALWADPLGERQYRLNNIPHFAYGINLGDEFLARTVEGGPRPHFEQTLTFSGNQTVRITLAENRSDDTGKTLHDMFEVMRHISTGYETYGPDYHVFNVPRGKLTGAVEALLDKGEDEMIWSWELSTPDDADG